MNQSQPVSPKIVHNRSPIQFFVLTKDEFSKKQDPKPRHSSPSLVKDVEVLGPKMYLTLSQGMLQLVPTLSQAIHSLKMRSDPSFIQTTVFPILDNPN